jgi:Protein of unknown function (DUF4238)
LSSQPKKKNNHFVPRSYLQRFCSGSDRQIALFNLKSGRTVEAAPIKSQCSRDYFYTRNSIFEKSFARIEGQQKRLLSDIIASQSVPAHGSADRALLSSGIMFQAGRTTTTVANTDHVTNQFGKALLRHHLTKEGRTDLLEHLPKLEITMTDAVMHAVRQHLAMYPLIEDMDNTLFLNDTDEDFLTSDHPVALCNGLPATHTHDRRIGFASRGLIIVYPISPRALLFLSDAEVYKVEKNSAGASTLRRRQEVIELNLAQCGYAYENLYFASLARVQGTLGAFRKRADAVRPPRPALKETPFLSEDNCRGALLDMSPHIRRLPIPKVVKIRYAAKTGKYKLGNGLVRDPMRVQVVKAKLERLQKLWDEGMKNAEGQKSK